MSQTTDETEPGGQQYLIPGTEVWVSKSVTQMLEDALADDEPVFLIRAKDIFSLPTLYHYMEQVERYGPQNVAFAKDINNILTAMKNWQHANPSKVKYPD